MATMKKEVSRKWWQFEPISYDSIFTNQRHGLGFFFLFAILIGIGPQLIFGQSQEKPVPQVEQPKTVIIEALDPIKVVDRILAECERRGFSIIDLQMQHYANDNKMGFETTCMNPIKVYRKKSRKKKSTYVTG